jgi:hypothetical protein
LRRALAIKEHWLGRNHVELVPTLGTLGVVRRRRGDEREARRLYERAIRLLHERVADDHPHIATLKANLARLTAGNDFPTEAGDTRLPRATWRRRRSRPGRPTMSGDT